MRPLIILILLVSNSLLAENWPAWRGPRGDGTTTDKSAFPTQWTNIDNVTWKAALPGPGNSTPIVWNDRVFITQQIDKGAKRALLCFNRADGKLLWQRDVAYAGKEPTHKDNPFCSASPVTDGECVVAWHGSAGLAAYDMDGKELWQHTDFGEYTHIWGNASSPVLYKNMVIAYMGPGIKVNMVALEKSTGKEIWKLDLTKAQSKNPGEFFGGWSTPFLRTFGQRTELIFGLPKVLTSFDPLTGKELWTCAGLGPLVYNDVLATDDIIVQMSGFNGPALGLKTGGSGDVTATHRLWHETKEIPQRVGSGVIVGEHIYIHNDPGFMQSIELKSGKEVWREKLGGQCWGSMSHVDGKLYVIDTSGTVYVTKPGPAFELVQKNKMGETTRASLAFSDGQIFIRTYQNLYCIGKAAEKK